MIMVMMKKKKTVMAPAGFLLLVLVLVLLVLMFGAVESARLLEETAGNNKEEADVRDVEEEDVHDVDKLIPEFMLGEPVKDWDKYRREWAASHPDVKPERLFMITGTQPYPCKNPEGDHLLLRCFKNKVDYSRIHGVGLFYNMALLDPDMPTFWAKLPIVRATMLAHPEVEWVWWLDSDAIVTDMEFDIPLERYDGKYNIIVHGWEGTVYEQRSWVGLNAGSFLIRNCQWSMDLLERWAAMGPKAPMGDAYRNIISDFLPDRPRVPTDDQAALVYLITQETQRWGSKLRIELDFFLSGYWVEHIDDFESVDQKYKRMEELDQLQDAIRKLLQPHLGVGKEKMVPDAGKAREEQIRAAGMSAYDRRPFITHFTGCQPCSGNHNPAYPGERCRLGLIRALNSADDQVLRTLGYQHSALHLPDVIPTTVI